MNGLYQVSDKGRVQSLNYGNTGTIALLRPIKIYGYLRVRLYKNNKYKNFYVHRLVAEAFIPNQKNKPDVNHKDGDKQNNTSTNLEWCTEKENTAHAIKNKLFNICVPVNQYDKQHNLIRQWKSQAEAFKELGIKHISCCCKGKRKTAGGYIWEYVNKGGKTWER